MQTYWLLLIAIAAEVTATSALKLSEGFTRLWPSVIVLIFYCASLYLLSLVLKTIPVGIAYAIWAGLGIVIVTLIGWVVYKQSLDWQAVLGMALIVAGVVIINLFSKVSHD